MESLWKVIDSYNDSGIITTTEAMDCAYGVLVRVTILFRDPQDDSITVTTTMNHIPKVSLVLNKDLKSKFKYELIY